MLGEELRASLSYVAIGGHGLNRRGSSLPLHDTIADLSEDGSEAYITVESLFWVCSNSHPNLLYLEVVAASAAVVVDLEGQFLLLN